MFDWPAIAAATRPDKGRASACRGTADLHCCWLQGQVCEHFDPEGFTNAGGGCSLRTELGTWDQVHADPRYLLTVGPVVNRLTGGDCGDWPPPGTVCNDCGSGK